MAKIESLNSTGILLTNGELDEVTGSAVSANDTAYLAAEFDEITISPVSSGLAKRLHSNGLIQVANYFDEYTLTSIPNDGLRLYLDAVNYPSSPYEDIWPDTSGYNNDATLVSPDYHSGPPAYFDFTGSNYATMGTILNRNAYTKCVMFYVNSFGYNNNLLSGGGGDLHAFWLGGTQYLRAGHNGDTGGSWSTVIGTTQLQLNQWYFGAVTFNNSTGWKLYLNGVEEDSDASTLTFSGNDPGYCQLAAYQSGNNFVGRIPFALVYNRALSDSEILGIFNTIRGTYGI